MRFSRSVLYLPTSTIVPVTTYDVMIAATHTHTHTRARARASGAWRERVPVLADLTFSGQNIAVGVSRSHMCNAGAPVATVKFIAQKGETSPTPVDLSRVSYSR